jgi:hypothetical protein
MSMINLLDPKWKRVFKVIGLLALLFAGLAFGEYRYVKGRIDECYEHNGILKIDNQRNYVCETVNESLRKVEILNNVIWVVDDIENNSLIE